MQPDDHLWEAFNRAKVEKDEAALVKARAAIVEHHLSFFKQYVSRTAPASWDADTRLEYLHEIVIIALQKVDTFDPSYDAKFVTYVRKSLRMERNKHQARQSTIWKGNESTRIEAQIKYLKDRALLTQLPLTLEQIQEEVSKSHGKTITKSRLMGIMNQPRVVSTETAIEDSDDDMTLGEILTYKDDDMQDTVAEREHTEMIKKRVREAIAKINPTTNELVVIERVLMAPPKIVESGTVIESGPLSEVELGKALGITTARALTLKKSVIAKLVAILG